MFTKKNNGFLNPLCILILVWWVIFSAPVSAQSRNPLTIQLSSGLIVTMTPRTGWSFIQAELIIPLYDRERNPVIPRLTGENLFNRKLPDNDTGLIGSLTRLGGDYQIEYMPDEIRLKINFPSDQVRDFASLLKDIFTYKSFSLKRYDYSRLTFFDRLITEPDWVYQVARDMAYALFFPGHDSSRGPIQTQNFERLNLSYFRSFHSRVFKPERSILVMNGDLNPHITYGLIERTLFELKKQEISNAQRTVPFPAPPSGSRIVLLESEQFTQINAFVFNVIPPVHELEHFQERILHAHLYNIPHGRIYNIASSLRLRPIAFHTRINHHSNLSVISTEIQNTQYLGRILDLLLNERRRTLQKPFDEREYLVASNILLGQMKVETSRFDCCTAQSLHPILSGKPVPLLEFPSQLLKLNNYTRTIRYLGRKTYRQQSIPSYSPELIILTGNRAALDRLRETLSPFLFARLEVIPLRMD